MLSYVSKPTTLLALKIFLVDTHWQRENVAGNVRENRMETIGEYSSMFSKSKHGFQDYGNDAITYHQETEIATISTTFLSVS